MSGHFEEQVDEKAKIEKILKLPIIGKQPTSEKEEKFLREVCEYEFMNVEEPGVSMTFAYGDFKNRHKFTLFHSGKYKLPRFIARHVESCSTPIYDWLPDGTGKMHKKLTGRKPRFQMRQSYAM